MSALMKRTLDSAATCQSIRTVKQIKLFGWDNAKSASRAVRVVVVVAMDLLI